jgi:hypothetical protein
MDIKWKLGRFSKGSYYRDSNSDIGNETTVHYIDVNKIGSSSLNVCDGLTEIAKVSRED